VPGDDAGDVRPVTVVVDAGSRAARDVDSVVVVDPAVVIVVLAAALDLVRVVPDVALEIRVVVLPPAVVGRPRLAQKKSGST
jgi:hypothetical protein